MKECRIGGKYIIIASEEEWSSLFPSGIENLDEKIKQIIESKSYFTEYPFYGRK